MEEVTGYLQFEDEVGMISYLSVPEKIIFSKEWAMPNSNTFEINPINRFIYRNLNKYKRHDIISIDPFANRNRIAKITNDLDPQYDCDYNIDALDFLKKFDNKSVDFVLFDPPYSSRQVSESYKKLGLSVNMETTQSSFWGNMKAEISRITKTKGMCLCFGWNSGGVGRKYGFEMKEIMLVSHGGQHSDTICTAEIKMT